MATRRYKVSPGETIEQVISEVGAAVNSDPIELTVDLAATAVTTSSGTRAVTKAEVMEAIDKIKAAIFKENWLPA